LETALAALLALVHTNQLPLATLIAALTSRPARAFGLEAGTLAVGAPTDVVVFDPDEEWTVDPARFASKGRNTPLAGLTLRGRVRMTLLGGVVVYDAANDNERFTFSPVGEEARG
jgi:dihydroorotase